MAGRNPKGALTDREKKVAKALLNKDWRNQDIQALINIERAATINSARITEVKKNDVQEVATDDEVALFRAYKCSFHPRTGLNLLEDERLIRAREAMILAVQVFNSAALKFKTEVFAVLVNIAWTYLLHEYYSRKGEKIVDENDLSWSLSKMINRQDCPLSEGMRNNLKSIKDIRDEVEHKLLGRGDMKWLGLYQACCLNFNKILCDLFGDKLSLEDELGLALQFSRMNIEQLSKLSEYEIPRHIEVLDARLQKNLSPEQIDDLEYQFRVIYTMVSASKSEAHFKFVNADSADDKDIQNILVKFKPADHLYPHRPSKVVQIVAEKSGMRFTMHDHTLSWRCHNVRPQSNTEHPESTNRTYCLYHSAHKDYTYSAQWVDLLVKEVSND